MLLATKLYLPQTRTNSIARPRLLQLLDRGLESKLILVSAPAGFGKTTLVTEWVHRLRSPDTPSQIHNPQSTFRNPSISWLSLDESDNDPNRFLSYLVAALQKVDATIGASVQMMLQTPQPPSLELLLTMVINDLSSVSGSILLVLDDYHVITTEAIHEAITFLIEHLTPSLKIVMTTRTDPPLPLSRWRVRRLMTEIRQRDLRFVEAETATFLHNALGVALADEDVKALEARTEGWIAGLQLAALSMQRPSDRSSFIQHFTGNNAFVIDYLVEEVLQHQPIAVQQFLLQTSILQRFCAALCDAVTGRSDGRAMLDALQRANLFVISLDEERHWFRYHHLFAEVLQSRLRHNHALALTRLHLSASEWYERAGLPDEALQHALAAQALEQAAQIVEVYGVPLLLRSEVITLTRWLQALPTILTETRPQLAVLAAWVAMVSRQLDQLAYLVNTLPILHSPDLDEQVQSQVLILRAYLAFFRGDFAQSVFDARQSLHLIPPDLPSLRASALLILGSGLLRVNELAEAEAVLQETVVTGRVGGNLYNVMLAYHILSRFQSGRGDMSQALATLNEALQVAQQHGQALIPAVGVIYIGLGALWVVPEQYEQAINTLQKGEELTKACFQLDILLYGWEAQVKLHLAHGSRSQALVVVDEAEMWLKQISVDRLMAQHSLQSLHNLRMIITQSPILDQAHNLEIQNPKSPIQNLIEPLSERELEVLRLVAEGFSNNQIADQLIVTVGTVKKHLNTIFGKLGVGSRTQAIVRAREVKLL